MILRNTDDMNNVEHEPIWVFVSDWLNPNDKWFNIFSDTLRKDKSYRFVFREDGKKALIRATTLHDLNLRGENLLRINRKFWNAHKQILELLKENTPSKM